MAKHLEHDLESLKKELLVMGAMVEAAINKSILSLVERRKELSAEVIEGDDRINLKENQIEEECLRILAVHQPVAVDLRFIVVVLKVNSDLERMGDLSVNIAERANFLTRHGSLDVSLDFSRMAAGVRSMVRDSLDALVNGDTQLARRVIVQDDEIDDVNRETFGTLQELMRREPETIERAVHLLSTYRYLERIADLATNIAEDVVFMVDGQLIRHNVWQQEGD